LFSIRKQFTFYGAYHTNPINVAIHIVCVPLIMWSFQVMAAKVSIPGLPAIHYEFNPYMIFDLKFPAVVTIAYLSYYFALEPVAALIYTPQLTLSLLTATAYRYHGGDATMVMAGALHAVAWIAQFAGHGLAEKRAPALLDNIVGAVVLAPFFVHLEVLFHLGYRPALHKDLQNCIGKEVTRIRKIEGDKKRAAAAKKEL